jgi:hypothetical protein
MKFSLEYVVLVVFITLLIYFSSVFEYQYPEHSIQLFMLPWWRLLVVMLLVIGILWSPRVGIVLALIVYFYFADLQKLLVPVSTTIRAMPAN